MMFKKTQPLPERHILKTTAPLHFSSLKDRLIAHRGMSKIAPENTLESFKAVAEAGLSWLEFDVQMARCGTPVVIHDERLDRTTNAHGFVIDYDYHELSQFDAGSWFSKAFSTSKIPSLGEVLDCLIEFKLNANIEIKPAPTASWEDQKTLVQKTISELAERPSLTKDRVLVSSFSSQIIELLANESYHFGFLQQSWEEDRFEFMDRVTMDSLHYHYSALNHSRIQKLRQSWPNRKILVYTVNSTSRAKALFADGVDAVFSDVPLQLLQKLNPTISGENT